MATKTVIARPTEILCYKNDSYMEKLFPGFIDNNPDEAGVMTLVGSGNGACVLTGFDFSSIPAGSTINNVTVYFKANSDNKAYVTKTTCALCDEVWGIDDYTALPDGVKILSQNEVLEKEVLRAAQFPEALQYLDFFNYLTKQLKVRFYIAVATGSVLKTMFLMLYDLYVEVEYETPTYTVLVKKEPPEGGSVTGSGSYEVGTVVYISATPAAGYEFLGWGDGETNSERTYVVTAGKMFVALFGKKTSASKIYCGSKAVSVYCGTKKASVFYGCQGLL